MSQADTQQQDVNSIKDCCDANLLTTICSQSEARATVYVSPFELTDNNELLTFAIVQDFLEIYDAEHDSERNREQSQPLYDYLIANYKGDIFINDIMIPLQSNITFQSLCDTYNSCFKNRNINPEKLKEVMLKIITTNDHKINTLERVDYKRIIFNENKDIQTLQNTLLQGTNNYNTNFTVIETHKGGNPTNEHQHKMQKADISVKFDNPSQVNPLVLIPTGQSTFRETDNPYETNNIPRLNRFFSNYFPNAFSIFIFGSELRDNNNLKSILNQYFSKKNRAAGGGVDNKELNLITKAANITIIADNDLVLLHMFTNKKGNPCYSIQLKQLTADQVTYQLFGAINRGCTASLLTAFGVSGNKNIDKSLIFIGDYGNDLLMKKVHTMYGKTIGDGMAIEATKLKMKYSSKTEIINILSIDVFCNLRNLWVNGFSTRQCPSPRAGTGLGMFFNTRNIELYTTLKTPTLKSAYDCLVSFCGEFQQFIQDYENFPNKIHTLLDNSMNNFNSQIVLSNNINKGGRDLISDEEKKIIIDGLTEKFKDNNEGNIKDHLELIKCIADVCYENTRSSNGIFFDNANSENSENSDEEVSQNDNIEKNVSGENSEEGDQEDNIKQTLAGKKRSNSNISNQDNKCCELAIKLNDSTIEKLIGAAVLKNIIFDFFVRVENIVITVNKALEKLRTIINRTVEAVENENENENINIFFSCVSSLELLFKEANLKKNQYDPLVYKFLNFYLKTTMGKRPFNNVLDKIVKEILARNKFESFNGSDFNPHKYNILSDKYKEFYYDEAGLRKYMDDNPNEINRLYIKQRIVVLKYLLNGYDYVPGAKLLATPHTESKKKEQTSPIASSATGAISPSASADPNTVANFNSPPAVSNKKSRTECDIVEHDLDDTISDVVQPHSQDDDINYEYEDEDEDSSDPGKDVFEIEPFVQNDGSPGAGAGATGGSRKNHSKRKHITRRTKQSNPSKHSIRHKQKQRRQRTRKHKNPNDDLYDNLLVIH
jgi:hypothetical protein